MPPLYSSVGLVNSAYPPISSVTALSSPVVAQFIDDVEAEINGKIGKRYTLPLSVTVPLLQAISTREAIYRICVQRVLIQFPPAQQGSHPLQIQHKDDQKLLDQIMNGEIPLVTSSGTLIDPSETNIQAWSTTKDYAPVIAQNVPWDLMRNDSTRTEDELAERGLTNED